MKDQDIYLNELEKTEENSMASHLKDLREKTKRFMEIMSETEKFNDPPPVSLGSKRSIPLRESTGSAKLQLSSIREGSDQKEEVKEEQESSIQYQNLASLQNKVDDNETEGNE